MRAEKGGPESLSRRTHRTEISDAEDVWCFRNLGKHSASCYSCYRIVIIISGPLLHLPGL